MSNFELKHKCPHPSLSASGRDKYTGAIIFPTRTLASGFPKLRSKLFLFIAVLEGVWAREDGSALESGFVVVKENSNGLESCQEKGRRKPPPGTGLTQVRPAKTASDGPVSWGLHTHSAGWNKAHPSQGLTAQVVQVLAVHIGFDSYGFPFFFHCCVAMRGWWRPAPLKSRVWSPRK